MRETESDKRTIEVVGIDNSGVYHLTRIRRDLKGDLYWFPSATESRHLSWHRSGEIHWSGKPKMDSRPRQGTPLAEIPFQQVVGFGLPVVRAAALGPFKLEGCDGVFMIDLRRLAGPTIHFNIFLVAPAYIGPFFAGASQMHDVNNALVFLYTAAEPWLVLFAESPAR